MGAGNASFKSIKSYFKNLQRPTEDVRNQRLGDRLSCGTSAESEGSKPVLGPSIARLGQENIKKKDNSEVLTMDSEVLKSKNILFEQFS